MLLDVGFDSHSLLYSDINKLLGFLFDHVNFTCHVMPQIMGCFHPENELQFVGPTFTVKEQV